MRPVLPGFHASHFESWIGTGKTRISRACGVCVKRVQGWLHKSLSLAAVCFCVCVFVFVWCTFMCDGNGNVLPAHRHSYCSSVCTMRIHAWISVIDEKRIYLYSCKMYLHRTCTWSVFREVIMQLVTMNGRWLLFISPCLIHACASCLCAVCLPVLNIIIITHRQQYNNFIAVFSRSSRWYNLISNVMQYINNSI